MNEESRNPRIGTANKVLATLGKYSFSWRNGLRIHWETWRGEQVTKRWSSGRNFYPPFNLPCGGTQTTAIAQLARYCQGRNSLPLNTWRYWGTLKLWKDDESRDKAIALLEGSDYPKKPVCVFCGNDLTGKQWDWYSWKGSEGVGCWAKVGDRPCPSDSSGGDRHEP